MGTTPEFKKIAEAMNTATPVSITQARWRYWFALVFDWFNEQLWKIPALLGNGTPADARRLLGLEHVTIAYTDRGDWKPDTDYDTNDLVWWEGSTYGAMVSHHSSDDFKADLHAGLWRAVGGDLAEQLDAPDGSARIGFVQSGDGAAPRTALDKMRERITVDDYFQIGEADCTNAFERAGLLLASRGGGTIVCPNPSYTAAWIVIRRSQIIEGSTGSGVELKQAPGSNRDFITSESFAALTGSGRDVAADARVPSWLGLRRVRVDGNSPNNTSGRGVALYGASLILDDLTVTGAAGDGLYTEYATNVTGTADWTTQEEGYIRNLVSRNNGGVGWRNRGPHNAFIDNAVCCFNGDWGYYSEILSGKYNGAPTYVTSLHCYSNDASWTPDSGRARRNMYIGTNMSCGLLVVDGAQCEIRGSNSLIGIVTDRCTK